MSFSVILDENVSLDVKPVVESFNYEVTAVALMPDRGVPDTAVFDLAVKQKAIHYS